METIANNPIENLGVDILETTEIMNMLGVDTDELSNPAKFGRLKDVIKFLADRPDKSFIVSKLTAGKAGIDKIDHIWGYAMLRNEHDKQSQKLEELKKELSFYE